MFGEDYEIPVVVKDFGDSDAEAAAIIENVHRMQMSMSIAEGAKAAKRLLSTVGDTLFGPLPRPQRRVPQFLMEANDRLAR